MKRLVINRKKDKQNIIPIMFATDDNYSPFLAVALESILQHSNTKNVYKIFVLESNLSQETKNNLMKYNRDNFNIKFINVANKLDKISSKLHLRDYYTNTTYYRFFIPSIFNQYKKCLYLDCDIVVLDDIAKLYNHNLKNNLLGAIQEDVFISEKVFADYGEKALGVYYKNYFNAGILVMNLDKLRDFDIETKFVELLSKFKFTVAQDQDYLNVLCHNQVSYLSLGWNKSPLKIADFSDSNLKLVHYKLSLKPWHYDGIAYGEYFWQYAKNTCYYEKLLEIKNNYNDDKKLKDITAYENLKNKAIIDTKDKNNYYNTICKNLETDEIFDIVNVFKEIHEEVGDSFDIIGKQFV